MPFAEIDGRRSASMTLALTRYGATGRNRAPATDEFALSGDGQQRADAAVGRRLRRMGLAWPDRRHHNAQARRRALRPSPAIVSSAPTAPYRIAKAQAEHPRRGRSAGAARFTDLGGWPARHT